MADPLSQFDPVFQAAGTEWNVDPTLLKAVAAQESGGRVNAVSPANAQGLMQITPATQKYLGVTDPNDPVQSIYGAAKYLNEGLDKEGTPEGALLYYHGGPGWRQAYGPESQAYVPGVTKHYQAFQSQQPPAQTQAQPPSASTPPPSSTGPLIIGDSLASKGGLGGSGVVGASPSAVLGNINGMQPEDVNGRDVILSSGASNDTSQAALLEDQIKALQAKGARNISVVGVGNAPKLAGVNDALAATAGRFGASFVPLDTTQLSPDGVHPTQKGYRTLLAAATPRVTTDASPGTPMASDDPLSLLPPAPKPSTPAATAAPAAQSGGATTPAAAPASDVPDDPLSLLPPAPKPSTAAQQPTLSERNLQYADTGSGDLPASVMQGPAGQTADEKLRNLLAPAPNTTYGSVLPLARDDTTGELRFAMPSALRDPLLGLTGGVGGNALTIDPSTNAVRLTPEASSVAPFAATPLRFGGQPTPLLSPEFRANPLSPEARTAAAEPPAGPTSSTGVPPPQPAAVPGEAQPVGAQVTVPGAATLTPDEVNAYRATAEGKKLLENQVVGEPDRNAYIPGSNPNLAEQEQTVNSARELKSLGITSQDASQEMKLVAQANNDARTSYFQDTAKSPVDIQKAEAARDAQAQADLKATWANKTEADATPVLDAANQILSGPDGRRPAVRSAVNSVTSELQDANGDLITDPEILYGVRKHIGDLLSKEGQRETPLAVRATDNLITLRDSLDGVIEQAAPGFQQYLKNFSDASKPIDEMQVLQDVEPNLFKGPQSTMRYSDFQRFMKNIVDMRQAQGVNPYKSISDDTMQRLWNLRDDLRRSAGAMDLARAVGSDTTPNIIDAIKQYGKLGGNVAIDGAASHFFGPAGPMIVRGGRALLAPVTAARTARAQMRRVQEMLHPSNPLTQPPSANPLGQAPPP